MGVGRGELNEGGEVRLREERSILVWELKRKIPVEYCQRTCARSRTSYRKVKTNQSNHPPPHQPSHTP